MNRLLFDGFENFGLQVAEINGGGLRNAIPRESVAKVIVAGMYDEAYVFDMQEIIKDITTEFKTTEPNLTIEIVKSDLPKMVMDLGVQEGILRSIYAAHNGVYRMSTDMPDLVETSNNIAKVLIKEGQITISCLTRSSLESSKVDLANALRSVFELCGCQVTFSGSYPGWTPNLKSEILDLLVSIYQKQNNEKPKVVACHAGLECGILGTNYPNMDMISFGPTIRGAHSPDERASILSSQKFYRFVLEILKNIPLKTA
jgi:dipeptidase D